MRIGTDTGGTFTDLVDETGRVTKVLSTPDDPGRAVAEGLTALGRSGPDVLTHGTTVATNALLERRGAAVALICTDGLADVIEIARQDRPSLYDPLADRPEPLVPRSWRHEAPGRLDAHGEEIEPFDSAGLPELDPAVEAVAICLLHADLNPSHEEAVEGALAGRGLDVVVSHRVSPEFREYERTVTTVANAYLRPICRSYLEALAALAGEVLVMSSAGGLLPVSGAADLPVALLLSGPAGGVRAGAAAARANGFDDAVTFDMGGTSTDVCLVLGGEPQPAAEREVAGFPIRMPSLDVHTIGAGGGSIASVDPGGALAVGPRSAGAVPGPACYGRGGRLPTVTDANVVLGRIPAEAVLPGLGTLDRHAASTALAEAGVTAEGVVRAVDVNMEGALRTVTVARGVDPRRLALVAFGGAGPLHACSLADALSIPVVIVPARAGVLSAAGILGAPEQRDLVRSWPTPSDHGGLAGAADRLGAEAAALVGGGAEVRVRLDCRYAGQSHELSVPSVESFHDEHERRNGYSRPEAPVEVVAIRATASRPSPVEVADLPDIDRASVVGPAVVAEPDCTIWVPEGWRGEQGAAGSLVLRRDR